MPAAVHRLFRACRDVFSNVGNGGVASPEDVQRIKSILDKMKPADVNVSPGMPYLKKEMSATKGVNRELPPITYLHVYECDKFSIGIFCLPPSSVIPLHNHPGMTVFSKLLFGSLHIKSYDWHKDSQESNKSSNPNHSQPPGVRLAKVKADAILTAPCDASILYAESGGNMHCFTAITACAVLDVLGPPYSDSEGRPCTYYNVHSYEKFSGDTDDLSGKSDEYAWLDEREKPEDFVVQGGKYQGPKI